MSSEWEINYIGVGVFWPGLDVNMKWGANQTGNLYYFEKYKGISTVNLNFKSISVLITNRINPIFLPSWSLYALIVSGFPLFSYFCIE